MTEDERRRGYAAGFIAQARSDWEVYEVLSARSGIPTCHRLHYLQMACEKVAKAYRLRDTKSPVDELIKKHTGFAKFFPSFCKVVLGEEYRGKKAQLERLITHSRLIAREIERLAPASDRVATPENAEYPWERDGKVIAPRDHEFPGLALLEKPSGLAFLKILKRSLDSFVPANP